MVQREVFTPIDSPNPEIVFDITRKVVAPFTKSIISYAMSETGRQVVIKVPVGEGKAEREWVGLIKAYTASLPVPEPIALVRTQAGKFALVTERIYGNSLYSHPDNQAHFLLGQAVRRMHEQITVEGRGWFEKGKADYTYYDKLLRSWLRGQAEYYIDAKSKAQALLNLLADPMRTHCKSVSPRFNHNDIHDGQVIVKKRNITLIDFETWIEDSPLNDIAVYIFHSIRTGQPKQNFESFLRGYIGRNNFSEVEKSSLMFYLLFISSRALNYFHQQGSPYVETAKITHQNILGYAESENLWKYF